jgi:hypothetical protein
VEVKQMKASEMIRKLQEQIELHGDCEVCVESYDYDFDYDSTYDVHRVEFNQERGKICI